MRVRFKFQEKLTLPKGKTVFRPNEFALVYLPIIETSEECIYVIADTLTLEFDLSTGILLKFDAYTNSEKWLRKTIDLPEIEDSGHLICIKPIDNNRIDLGVTPTYEYSELNRRLRIRLKDDTKIKHYRVLQDLIIGKNSNNEITELIISDIKEEL